MNMLGLAKRCRARFLISSTSEVYGDPLQHPQTEEYWGEGRRRVGWCVCGVCGGWGWGGGAPSTCEGGQASRSWVL